MFTVSEPFISQPSYVSRANPKDKWRHSILSTFTLKPGDFASQLNVSFANGWGIVRTITDLCMKQPNGKYVLIKDPNRVRAFVWLYIVLIYLMCMTLQPVIRLYAVPMTAFVTEDIEEEVGEENESGN